VHPAATGPSDYYENTPNSELFVRGLRETRERQARELIARLGRAGEADRPWLDFGCGRGWFLQQAKAAGRRRLAGFDASEISLGWLREEGMAGARPRPDEFWPDWNTLGEAPEVVSLLDVLEHFRDPRAVLERLARELPALRRIVVKVPTAEGILFQVAKAARGFAPSIYEQLFQVGTFPPHYHYFSRASFRALLKKLPFEIEGEWRDREVDNLFWRIPALEKLPGGELAGGLLGLLPKDSTTWLLKVKR
jgi:SAM-dependent methyltransferase